MGSESIVPAIHVGLSTLETNFQAQVAARPQGRYNYRVAHGNEEMSVECMMLITIYGMQSATGNLI